jgi:hypothetical protein
MMKVILKTRQGESEPAERIVESSIRQTVSDAMINNFSVSRLFPNLTHGNRSRMVSLTVPDSTSSRDLETLVEILSNNPRFEYVQIPEQKTFL